MPINPDAAGSGGQPAEFSWTSTDSRPYATGGGAGGTGRVGPPSRRHPG